MSDCDAYAGFDSLGVSNFDAVIAGSEVPYVVKFWAPWCGHCKAMAPVVEAVANEHTGSLRFGAVNIDEHPDLAESYRATTIPTLIVFRGGREQKRIVGAKTKEVLAGELARFIQR